MDNYNKIRGMLNFEDPDCFYYLQILKRRKDNPDLSKDMIPLVDLIIDSMEKFDSLENMVKAICNSENARAYLRINRRSKKRTANETLILLTGYVISGEYNAAKSAYMSACGRNHSDKDKKWIIDVDWADIPEDIDRDDYLDGMIKKLRELLSEAKREPAVIKIPTKNGIHLITRPFRLDKFQDFYKETIHKDNPTLLYCK
jgi:hypothetical protein